MPINNGSGNYGIIRFQKRTLVILLALLVRFQWWRMGGGMGVRGAGVSVKDFFVQQHST